MAQSETTQGAATGKRQRVLSGMRPTGKLHIGNYFGALDNWLKLQADDSNDCYFFVADWHSLTSDYADTSQISQNTIEIATDFLASGLDPNKSTIFQQSQVPEHAELHLLLSMVTPLGWLERVPTYKEALENIQGKDLHTYGFLGYPVLQTADIVMYGEPGVPLVVPVGEDQLAHVELGREIVRRSNSFSGWKVHEEKFKQPGNYGPAHELFGLLCKYWSDCAPTFTVHAPSREVVEWIARAVRQVSALIGARNLISELAPFPDLVEFLPVLREPEVLLTRTPRVPGTDGRKMSKSYGNAIALSESDADIRAKAKVMITDPARKRRTDPGNPDVCPVFDWHRLFSNEDVQHRIRRDCTTAAIGCVDCKQIMADGLIKWIEPVRARRKEYEAKPGEVLEILDAGSKKAREVAKSTMARVREAVFGWNKLREGIAGNAIANAKKQNVKAGD